MQNGSSRNASWRELLASPAPGSHIVQIYDEHDFLASAVAHFAAEGLRRGEAVVLSGTKEHLADVRGRLAAADADPEGAARTGQILFADVYEGIAALSSLDAEGFDAMLCATLSRLCTGRRSPGGRWWGEISNALYHRGERESALLAEALSTKAAAKYGATIFCSFLYDKFEPNGYEGILREMCCTHSHAIPAEDYVRHRLAVNRAIADVVGDIKGSLLQSLATWKGLSCELPSSQAILFWLREVMPEHFDAVLARARVYAHGAQQLAA